MAQYPLMDIVRENYLEDKVAAAVAKVSLHWGIEESYFESSLRSAVFKDTTGHRTLGSYRYRYGLHVVCVSKHCRAAEGQWEDTILHEIAHLLHRCVQLHIGIRHESHGSQWREIARWIGATPEACTHSPAAVLASMANDLKVVGRCPSCGWEWKKKKHPRAGGYGCPKCSTPLRLTKVNRW